MKLNIKNLQRKELRSKQITIRTFPSYSKWLGKNNISPSKLFNESVEYLMNEVKEK